MKNNNEIVKDINFLYCPNSKKNNGRYENLTHEDCQFCKLKERCSDNLNEKSISDLFFLFGLITLFLIMIYLFYITIAEII